MFIPGPVDVAPEVLAAQARPMIPHRGSQFETLFRRTAEKAALLFNTRGRVFQAASSGSGMQETGVRSLVGESILSLVNGAFSGRWHEVALANGKKADRVDVVWGQAVEPDVLASALKKRRYEAVTIVHNEVSTGVENPVRELAAVVREISPETLVLVDASSSLGGVKIEMDAWGIDFLLASSHYWLALPPGLAFAAVSDRAMKKAASVPNRGWVFDLVLMEKHRLQDSTPATPPISLLYAWDAQLDRILSEGLDARFARYAAMAERVQSWSEGHGMEPLAPPGRRSRTVTVIQNSRGLDTAGLNQFLCQRGMRVAGGYGALKDKTFRIAHMGETWPADIELLLASIEEFMAR